MSKILTSDLEGKVDKMRLNKSNRNMNENKISNLESFKTFIQLHKNQLESSGVPAHLWQSAYSKLINAVSLLLMLMFHIRILQRYDRCVISRLTSNYLFSGL